MLLNHTAAEVYLFGTAHLTHRCWEATPRWPRCLRPLRRRGRLINRPLQPMKTGGNNPDERQIWSLSYKTNFNHTPFFKSSSGWRTRELNPCGCGICFSLIALSGYLIRWQMTKTPPVTDRLSLPLCLSLIHKLFHTMLSLSFPLTSTLTLFYPSPQGHTQPHWTSHQISIGASAKPFFVTWQFELGSFTT